jgi:hypothetical protein
MKTQTSNGSVCVNLSRKLEFPAASSDFQRSLLLNHLSDEDVLILAGNISKLLTTFVYGTFPKYVPLAVRIEFSDNRLFRTDFVPKGKTKLKMCRHEI